MQTRKRYIDSIGSCVIGGTRASLRGRTSISGDKNTLKLTSHFVHHQAQTPSIDGTQDVRNLKSDEETEAKVSDWNELYFPTEPVDIDYNGNKKKKR